MDIPVFGRTLFLLCKYLYVIESHAAIKSCRNNTALWGSGLTKTLRNLIHKSAAGGISIGSRIISRFALSACFQQFEDL